MTTGLMPKAMLNKSQEDLKKEVRIKLRQIAVSQKVIEQAEENFRISEERYKESVATSTEVLDAQTLLTKAKSEYANALGDYNINYAKLQRATGTIWP